MSREQEEAVAQIEALPYLAGYRKAPAKSGVTRYQKSLVYPGLNLFISGHAPSAFLVDMEGKKVHEWSLSSGTVWPKTNAAHWRQVYLFDNGDLLAIFEGGARGLVKIDKDSNLIWAYGNGSNQEGPHHDLDVDEEGNIYLIVYRLINDVNYRGLKFNQSIQEDWIAVLDPDGKEIASVSLIEAFQNSEEYAAVLKKMRKAGDIFHTNTVEVLSGACTEKAPMLTKGRVLISSPFLDTIAVVDLKQRKVTWALSGGWDDQHQPTVTDNCHIMLFDNLGNQGTSRVIELDPVSREWIWIYDGEEERPLFTKSCGTNQRLPNGNTLITESEAGRAFEVTPEKKIVWEYFNPYRAGEKGELIATLFELRRVATDRLTFLKNKGS